MYKTLVKRAAVAAVATAVSAVTLGAVSATAFASNKPASSKPTYVIAYEGPLSGGNAQLGLNMKFSVQLAINYANEGKTFGKLPFTLKFLPADDQGSATISPTTAGQLVSNSQVMAVVGPAFSGATEAAEPTFSAADLATVSPSATAPVLAQKGWHNFFRVVADDDAQGPADAVFAQKRLHAHSIYSVDDGSTYAQGLVGAFDTKAKALGMKLSHQTALATSQCGTGNTGNVDQYPALATTIKSSKAHVVFYAGYYCDFALLAKALHTAGYTGGLMSDDGSLDPHYVKEAGANVANGTYISCACADLTASAAARPFAKAFQKLAGFPVGTYSAEAYDCTNTVIDVMKHLGAHVTRQRIVNALHKVTFKGLTKVVHFKPNGNIAGTAVYMYRVKAGKIGVLGLAP
ncbi:MAG: branched-chain amino acid ABC transporter substrate-binding protein [Acidimicrobiales bacterium]